MDTVSLLKKIEALIGEFIIIDDLYDGYKDDVDFSYEKLYITKKQNGKYYYGFIISFLEVKEIEITAYEYNELLLNDKKQFISKNKGV